MEGRFHPLSVGQEADSYARLGVSGCWPCVWVRKWRRPDREPLRVRLADQQSVSS